MCERLAAMVAGEMLTYGGAQPGDVHLLATIVWTRELSAGWRGVSDGMRVFSKMRTPERRRRQACSPTTAKSRMDQTPEIFHLFASLFGADFIFSFTQRPKPPL